MRIDLFHGGCRTIPARLGLEAFKLRAGVYPEPVVTISYRPDLISKNLTGYILRGMHGSGGWSKGDAELFAAFVSSLNSCHF